MRARPVEGALRRHSVILSRSVLDWERLAKASAYESGLLAATPGTRRDATVLVKPVSPKNQQPL